MSRKYGKIKVGKCAHGAVLPDLSVVRPITRALAFGDAPGSGVRIVAGNAIGDLCFLDMRLPRERIVSSGEDEPTSGRVKSHGARAAEPPLGVQVLSGASGAITGLACGGCGMANFPLVKESSVFNSENILIASSLDRYLRFYNRDTGVRLAKVYSKIPISSFLVSDNVSLKNLRSVTSDLGEHSDGDEDVNMGSASSESEESEFDEIWDQLPTVNDEDTTNPAIGFGRHASPTGTESITVAAR
ncbi:unnamed protein product [Echinostoma caproni]|uniref:Uncharacterized protein n=1 Tax=Echinostoma caproni TaxID=27848 RepID=A0A3P8GXT7_9TREM|nr:unnamed protein product [Echinostoma caproni]